MCSLCLHSSWKKVIYKASFLYDKLHKIVLFFGNVCKRLKIRWKLPDIYSPIKKSRLTSTNPPRKRKTYKRIDKWVFSVFSDRVKVQMQKCLGSILITYHLSIWRSFFSYLYFRNTVCPTMINLFIAYTKLFHLWSDGAKILWYFADRKK